MEEEEEEEEGPRTPPRVTRRGDRGAGGLTATRQPLVDGRDGSPSRDQNERNRRALEVEARRAQRMREAQERFRRMTMPTPDQLDAFFGS